MSNTDDLTARLRAPLVSGYWQYGTKDLQHQAADRIDAMAERDNVRSAELFEKQARIDELETALSNVVVMHHWEAAECGCHMRCELVDERNYTAWKELLPDE